MCAYENDYIISA